MDSEEFLAHYGVKGMKWGVRKDRLLAKYRARRAKRIMKRSINSIGVNKKFNTTKLTNEELTRLNERLKLETEFATYVLPRPAKQTPAQIKSQQKGKSFTVDVIQAVGKNAATATGTHLTKKWLNKKFGSLPKD